MKNTKVSEAKVFSSDIHINMGKEFVWQNFPSIRSENNPVYGVAGVDEVVIEPINFDTLNYLLMHEGTFLVLFGGVWSAQTQKHIGEINYYARKYGVDTVYMFDFSVDGTAKGTIKQDITAHEYYIVPDKKETNPFAIYNYLYGEIVTRHLTNLNNWVKKKIGGGDDITYLNQTRDPVTVPNLSEPFLFIYNRNNTIDHSGDSKQAATYPIVWAVELDDSEENIGTELVESIIQHVKEKNYALTHWTFADYVREAYAKNERGHAFKTEDAFTEDEPINLQAIPFQVYRWILKQQGTFLLMLVGPWCANSQAAVTTVNDYAVANNVRVYMTDSRLDSKHAIDFWKYPRKNELTMRCTAMRKCYVDIWENDLPGAPIISKTNRLGRTMQPTVDYTDETGRQHSVLIVGIPYCFAYNKDHVNGHDGSRCPVLSNFHNETMELINTSERYVYYAPTYREFKASVYKVFYAYKADLGQKTEEISIDRTAPIVPGIPVKHIETVAYYKEYNWYREPEDPKAINLTKNPAGALTFSSDIGIDMSKEYVYWNYPLLRKSCDPVYGVESSKEVVIQPVDFDTLCHVFMNDGRHMILFGGTWSRATQSVIGRINYFARKYGIGTVYMYDFSFDGTEYGSIKRDLTEQENYDGPDKKDNNPFAVYNYLYGEIVTRYLKNLNDWTANKVNNKNNITFLNVLQEVISVPNLSEPFLFLFDKDNTVDHSGCGARTDSCPILWAVELEYANTDTNSILEEKIFSHVMENQDETTPYTMEDYFRESFGKNERGHSFETKDSFCLGEKINLCKVSFPVFRWIIQQRGSFILQLTDSWCASPQSSVATMNDYAVANDVRVYMTDISLDSKYSIDFWHYPKKYGPTISCTPMLKYYIELWEKYFPGALIQNTNKISQAWSKDIFVEYTDEDGVLHRAFQVRGPYTLSYNKDYLDQDGCCSPLLATYQGVGGMINSSEEFIYHESIYREFRAGLYKIFQAYKKSLGQEARDPDIDRIALVVSDKPVQCADNKA